MWISVARSTVRSMVHDVLMSTGDPNQSLLALGLAGYFRVRLTKDNRPSEKVYSTKELPIGCFPRTAMGLMGKGIGRHHPREGGATGPMKQRPLRDDQVI